ncbi:MAG: DUF4143 domain-containing protein, partial [Bacteroidetes bacterium]|nr:DUF4143 domain-containing protein [Bacteroidota bacterium]
GLSGLCGDYLYQDILIHEQLKNPSVLRRLLRALAHQVGSQVSLNELSNLLGISRPTVEKYIDLLEKNFVIFSLESFSGNLRNEIRKSRKFYFYDNGIMNALTGNFMNTENRNDLGIIWENFCISERLKSHHYHDTNTSMFFWRTYDGAEIDLVENCNGEIRAFEFKWNKKPGYRFPDSFVQKYEPVKTILLTKENLHEIL